MGTGKVQTSAVSFLVCYVIFFVVFARWQQIFALPGSGKESFNHILDPDADPDHHQNLIISFKLGQD